MRKRALIFAGVTLIFAAGYLAWQPASLFFAVDGCLDQGGSFDYLTQTCDFERSHPYISHDESDQKSFLAAALVGLLGMAAITISKLLKSEEARAAK